MAYIENVPQGTVLYLQEGSGFRSGLKVLETYFIYLFIYCFIFWQWYMKKGVKFLEDLLVLQRQWTQYWVVCPIIRYEKLVTLDIFYASRNSSKEYCFVPSTSATWGWGLSLKMGIGREGEFLIFFSSVEVNKNYNNEIIIKILTASLWGQITNKCSIRG